MSDSRQHWYDDEAGPMVRLYAMTRGRAQPAGDTLDIIALIVANTRPERDMTLTPEQASILNLCRANLLSVAEIAARFGLPVSVVRILLADLFDAGHIRVTQPTLPDELPSEQILREVIHGLRAL